jgi:hypothetical protein
MTAAAGTSTDSQQYARFQGRWDGDEEEQVTFYNHNRGTYYGHVYDCLNGTPPCNLNAVACIVAANEVMPFLGITREKSIKQLSNLALWGLDRLWVPVHDALRNMIRCAYWKQCDPEQNLDGPLAALDAGQKELKKYLEKNIPQWLEDATDVGLNNATRAYEPSQSELSFLLSDIDHLLLHFVNFGSDALKNELYKLVRTAAFTPEEIAQNFSPASSEARLQSLSVTVGAISALIERGYEISLEEIIAPLSKDIISQLIPNLTAPEKLGPAFSKLLERWALFLVGGLKAYQTNENGSLLSALLTESGKSGTFLLLPQDSPPIQQVPQVRCVEIINASHPLASIACNAFARLRDWSQPEPGGLFSWFQVDARLSPIEKLGGSIPVQSFPGKRQAIRIPTKGFWTLFSPTPNATFAALFKSFLTSPTEDLYDLCSTLIEKGLNQWVRQLKAHTHPEILKEMMPRHVIPLVGIIRHYRNALLRTVLSGIKPSPFHEDFTTIVLENLTREGMSIVQSWIRFARPGQSFHLLDRSAEVVIASIRTSEAMSASFEQAMAKK